VKYLSATILTLHSVDFLLRKGGGLPLQTSMLA
jgi:hypothetical protein